MNCTDRNGEQLYVSRCGLYRPGLLGRARRSTHNSVYRILLSDGTLRTVPLKRIFAYTFLGPPTVDKGHVILTDYNCPEYNQYILTADCLSWGPRRHGKPVVKDSEDQETRPGEFWSKHPYLPIWVSGYNRFKRKNSGPVMEYISDTYHPQGYLKIHIEGKTYQFHRIVAESFLGLSPGKTYVVDHADGDTYNNSPLNLRWVTISENNSNSRRRALPVQKTDIKDAIWVPAVYG